MEVVLIVVGVWVAAALLFAAGWAASARRIFREPPAPPQLVIKTELSPEEAAADVIAQFKRQNRMGGL